MKNGKRGNIVRQITKPLSIFQTILAFVMLCPLLLLSLQRAVSEKVTSSSEIACYTAWCFEDYECLGRILDYMYEHYESMELVYGTEKSDEMGKRLAEQIDGYVNPEDVSPEQFDNMTEDVRKLYVEYCYSWMCTEMDLIKTTYDIQYLSAFIYKGDELFFVTTGKKEGEKRISDGGDLYELGDIYPYHKGNRPVLDKLVQMTKRPLHGKNKYYEFGKNGIINTYWPVFDENHEVCLVIGAYDKWSHYLLSSFIYSILCFLIVIILSIIQFVKTSHLLNKVVITPIRKEQDTLNEYIKDKDPEKVTAKLSEIKSDNEIQTLAENFSHMAQELDKYTNDLITVTAEKQNIIAELDMARNIQKSQLPSVFPPFPEHDEFDIYATMTPAKEVGGDFYDFFLTDEDHLAIVIADISDKGVPAALFMMRTKTIVKLYAKSEASPSRVLYAVNSSMMENNDECMFATLWLGILEISTGTFTYADAGHEKPIFCLNGKWELHEKEHCGMPLGITEHDEDNGDYYDQCISLSPGDVIFQYTDGVTEAAAEDGSLFGEQRVIEAAASSLSSEPRELLSHIHDRIVGFVGTARQSDDLTMLALRYNRKPCHPDKEKEL